MRQIPDTMKHLIAGALRIAAEEYDRDRDACVKLNARLAAAFELQSRQARALIDAVLACDELHYVCDDESAEREIARELAAVS